MKTLMFIVLMIFTTYNSTFAEENIIWKESSDLLVEGYYIYCSTTPVIYSINPATRLWNELPEGEWANCTKIEGRGTKSYSIDDLNLPGVGIYYISITAYTDEGFEGPYSDILEHSTHLLNLRLVSSINPAEKDSSGAQRVSCNYF